MPTVIVEVVGNNCSYFRQLTETDLRDMVRTFARDQALQAAHDSLWKLSDPVALESTAAVEFTIVDDSNGCDSCHASWLELHDELGS